MCFSETWNNKDKKLLTVLLAASKKTVPRKWLKVEPPIMDDWIYVVYKIYAMEKICHSLKAEKKKRFIESGPNGPSR